jgi:hypothetical protein
MYASTSRCVYILKTNTAFYRESFSMDLFRKLQFSMLESTMLYDAMTATTQANKWEWLRGYTGHFMYADCPELREIDRYIQYKDHTGSSYAWTMRNIQFIARNGFAEFARLREPMDWLDMKDNLASNPDLTPQADAFAKYERGELSFDEFKQLCG